MILQEFEFGLADTTACRFKDYNPATPISIHQSLTANWMIASQVTLAYLGSLEHKTLNCILESPSIQA